MWEGRNETSRWLEFQMGVSNEGDEAGEHQRPLIVSLELDPSPGDEEPWVFE